MKFPIEQYISNFVQSQFPEFYNREGPNFILFLKAYYEWMEESGNPIHEARQLFNYRDIDNTLEEFLLHFQEKYLYGIPFNVIINKRFLLKHILEVYRSKGSIECYKLLFKLIYNQDVEVYLPGVDILKPSDGTWQQPKYVEITDNGNLAALQGATVIGNYSGTTAVVESIEKRAIHTGIVSSLVISNISPKGGNFSIGEKIVPYGQLSNGAIVSNSPVVLGSLDNLTVLNGGQDFAIGDVLEILEYDINTGNTITFGTGGFVRVNGLSKSPGSINFTVLSGGLGYTANAMVFVDDGYYANGSQDTGYGAKFQVGSLGYIKNYNYNTDVISSYLSQTINTSNYNFPTYPSGNATNAPLSTILNYNTQQFGSIADLQSINTGNNYNLSPNVTVISTLLSANLPGTVNYSPSSNVITGTGTQFQYFFNNGDVVGLMTNNSTMEYHTILNVVSNTSMTVRTPPTYVANSTYPGSYMVAPSILPSNFPLFTAAMQNSNNSLNGNNGLVTGSISIGNNIVISTANFNSGKGYVAGQTVVAYRFNYISSVNIVNAGNKYTNGDILVFYGANSFTQASGYVNTYSNGTISNIILKSGGTGYSSTPNVFVKSLTGGNTAKLTATVSSINPFSYITGVVNQRGIGSAPGYWSTTRGFLNSDKYIQDSYFYQDYSYQLKVATSLNAYKKILYDTFHSTGSELFGQFLGVDILPRANGINYTTTLINSFINYLTTDLTNITIDDINVTIDLNVISNNIDNDTLTADATSITADQF